MIQVILICIKRKVSACRAQSSLPSSNTVCWTVPRSIILQGLRAVSCPTLCRVSVGRGGRASAHGYVYMRATAPFLLLLYRKEEYRLKHFTCDLRFWCLLVLACLWKMVSVGSTEARSLLPTCEASVLRVEQISSALLKLIILVKMQTSLISPLR